MNIKLLIIIIIGILIAVGAVFVFWYLPNYTCPEVCDDKNACTEDFCSAQTNYKCQYDLLNDCCGNAKCEVGEDHESCEADCPDCDDGNKCTEDYYDYQQQKCVNAPNTDVVCCGNGICEEGFETDSNCSVDCPSCDDNSRLTADNFNYATQKCENIVTHYFIEDFEQGVANWRFYGETEAINAGWSTELEGNNTVLRGLDHNWALLSNREWDDYVFKARFKAIKGGTNFNFRIKQTDIAPTRYFIWVDDSALSLSKQIQEDIYKLTDSPILLTLDEGWHVFEIRGYGNILNILIDNDLLIKYKDVSSPVLSGGIALEISDDSEFLIDDIEIKVIEASDVTYP